MFFNKHIAIASSVLVFSLVLPGCTLFSKNDKPNAMMQAYGNARTVRDIPMMPGATVDLKASLIIGPPEGWVGRLVLSSNHEIDFMCNFLLAEMPRLGWQPLAAIRAKISLLTFKRDSRVATVQIDEASFRGGVITINVAPEAQAGAWDSSSSYGSVGQGYELPASVETHSLGDVSARQNNY